MSNEIVKTDEHDAVEQYKVSTNAAGICRAIVTKTAANIKGKRYVQVEGWQAIAIAHGCTAGAEDVRKVEGGISAKGYIKRVRDGLILSTAEGFVGDDEPMWAKRPEYARRAMAQTRAISRACRSAFAHVVVLIDEGLSTTPAEEMYEETPSVVASLQDAIIAEHKRITAAGKSSPDLERWFAGLMDHSVETLRAGLARMKGIV